MKKAVNVRPNYDKRLAAEPEMKALERMLAAGKLDPERTRDYLKAQELKSEPPKHAKAGRPARAGKVRGRQTDNDLICFGD